MKKAKQLFFLLLLNITVSVLATIAVLRYWDSQPMVVTQPTTIITIIVTMASSDTLNMEQPVSTASQPSTPEILPTQPVEIQNQAYQVQEGDTLSKIAIVFRVGVEDIIRTNNLDDPNSLYTGQILLIPSSPLPTYTPDFSPTPRPTGTPTPQNTATPTASPTQDTSPPRLAIESVLGANVLDLERVKIIHIGGGNAALAGWRLTDEDGNSYRFPALFLYPKGSVTVNTRAGVDSVIDLFWGLSQPIWQPGEKATLYDTQNNIRAEFIVP